MDSLKTENERYGEDLGSIIRFIVFFPDVYIEFCSKKPYI